MSGSLSDLIAACGPQGNAEEFFELATELESAGDLHHAAIAYDRAYGLEPGKENVARARGRLLDRLAVTEHGLCFRYIPAGSFLMGSDTGDADERPVHAVTLDAYWLSDTPVSWEAYCRLMGWEAPPGGPSREISVAMTLDRRAGIRLVTAHKIRLQYCEDGTKRATDWHGHVGPDPSQVSLFHLDSRQKEALDRDTLSRAIRNEFRQAGHELPWMAYVRKYGLAKSGWQIDTRFRRARVPLYSIAEEQGRLAVYAGAMPLKHLFTPPPRENPNAAWTYNAKPMISVSDREAMDLCEKISTNAVCYRLPTEAEWEKAARGGFINCAYPWGDEPPTKERCDFERFDEFSILPMRRHAPNGYGLYAMAGGVWEWTADWYDSEYYREARSPNPTGPREGREKVLRGGCWSDCAEVLTVSFRTSQPSEPGPENEVYGCFTPNVGFRICRAVRVPEL